MQGNTLTGFDALSSQPYFEKHKRWLFRATFALFLGIVISTLIYAGHRQAGELLVSLGTTAFRKSRDHRPRADGCCFQRPRYQ